MGSDREVAVRQFDELGSLSRFGRRLLSALGYGFAVAFPALIVSAAYFNNPVSRLLSFDAVDGWCDAPTQGLGAHCFGDFQIIRLALADPSVWNNQYQEPIPYLPVSMFPNVIADGLEKIGLGVRGSMVVFLAALAVAILTPAVWAARRLRSRYPSGLFIALAGALTLPFFIVMDRGNSVGFVVPPLLGFFVGLRRGPRWLSPACFVIASMIRPQFAIVGLALLLVGRWKDAAFSLVALLLAIPASFVLWSGLGWRTSMSEWMQNFTGFDDYRSILAHYPVNISASRSLVVLTDGIGWMHEGLGQAAAEFVVGHTTLVTISMVGIVAGLMAVLRERVPLLVGVVLLVSTSILAPALEYSYYLVVALVVLPLVLVPSVLLTDQGHERRLLPAVFAPFWLFVLGVALFFSLVPIPFALFPGHQSIGLEVAGPMWLLLWVLSVALVVYENIHPERSSTVPSLTEN